MHTDSRSILRGTALTSGLTLLSRALGFVRDLLTALLLGAGASADAFFVAFRIPNLLRSLLAEGAMTSAFIPVFTEQLKQGKPSANQTFRDTLTLLLAVTLIASALGVLFAPQIADLFAPGFKDNPEQRELCIWLTRVMFPYIVFVSVVALISAALNTVKIFGVSALAQAVMNLVLIIGALLALLKRDFAIELLAYSVLIGGFIQVVIQIPRLKQVGFKLALSPSLLSPPVRSVLKLMIPAVFGAAIYQFAIFINTVLASLLASGSVSWLYYADRLVQLPIGVFTVALASVLLPTLSSNLVDGDSAGFCKNLSDSLRYTTFLLIPLAFFLIAFSEPLVALVFKRGAFSLEDTKQTYYAVAAYAIGIWSVSCHSMLVRAFIATKNIKLPTLVAALSLVLNLFFSLLFIGTLSSTTHGLAKLIKDTQSLLLQIIPLELSLGHVGLALASSCASIITFVLTFWLLLTRFKAFNLTALINCLIRTLLASGGTTFFSLYLIPSDLGPGWFKLLCQAVVFTAFFIFLCAILKIREFQETFSLISRKLKVRG